MIELTHRTHKSLSTCIMFITVGKSCDNLSSFKSGLINCFAHIWFSKHNFPTVRTASALDTGSLVTSLTPV